MNVIDFFNSDELKLPKTRNLADFETYLASILHDYSSIVGGLTDNDYISVEIKKAGPVISALCDSLIESVGRYFNGFPHGAYQRLAAGINVVRPHLDRMNSQMDVAASCQHLFRMRLGTMSPFTKGDLFHVPFEKRHLVATHRYSIPGLPCLYLGGSLWVCWEEMDRPAFHKIQMSLFRASAPIKLLDFGYRPALHAAMLSKYQHVLQGGNVADFVVSYAVCWPLIAACSIRVMSPGAHFVPEYIVPQQVLQWVVQDSKDCDGLRYFSTRIHQYTTAPSTACNYVFPVRQKQPAGYCQILRQKFELTDPSAWAVLQQATLPGKHTPNSTCQMQVSQGVSVAYNNTDFGKFENNLNLFPCSAL